MGYSVRRDGAKFEIDLTNELVSSEALAMAPTNADDATYFALRRQPGGVLQYDISPEALRQLREAGAIIGPIPPGRSLRFAGEELVVSPGAFPTFNALREAGEIVVTGR